MAVSCELRDQAPPEKAGTSGDENMHDDSAIRYRSQSGTYSNQQAQAAQRQKPTENRQEDEFMTEIMFQALLYANVILLFPPDVGEKSAFHSQSAPKTRRNDSINSQSTECDEPGSDECR